MSDFVRVIRILEYTGPRERVQEQLERSGVPNNGQKSWDGLMRIRSALLGDFADIIDDAEESPNDL